MRRIVKLLWIIFILCIVFFIICDEKWYKILFENNHIVFDKFEKKSESLNVKNMENIVISSGENLVYKNSDLIHINYEFENPRSLRRSDKVVPIYKNSDLVHINYEFENPKNLRKSVGVISGYLVKQETKQNTWTVKQETKQNTWTVKQKTRQNTWTVKQETRQNTWTVKQETKQNTWAVKQEMKQNTWIVIDSSKQSGHIVLYKNSNIIELYTWFENPRNMRKAIGVDEEFIANERKKQKWVGLVALDDGDTISSAIGSSIGTNDFDNLWSIEEKNKFYDNNELTWVENTVFDDTKNEINNDTWIDNEIDLNYSRSDNRDLQLTTWKMIVETWNKIQEKMVKKEKFNSKNHPLDFKKAIYIEKENKVEETISSSNTIVDIVATTWKIIEETWDNLQEKMVKKEKYEPKNHPVIVKKAVYIEKENKENEVEETISSSNTIVDIVATTWKTIEETWNKLEEKMVKIRKYKPKYHPVDLKKAIYIENIIQEEEKIPVEKPEFSKHVLQLSKWVTPEVRMVKIDKYQLDKHDLDLKKWKLVEYSFVVDDDIENSGEIEWWLSDPMLENLLENDEIDINTLESENDEFLQKVFEKTWDKDVMNLIIETYLMEYQFVKARKFIESLPEEYRNQVKPSLNLRVSFNSFALTSKTVSESLESLVQNYVSKWEITEENKNRYMWVIALMDQNYDSFFEIANNFTSESHKAFASKLQWYRDQISKQMWMPEYYFDTLVAFELFNQWLFQPAKVLALYSLQKDSNYILPYQVLAYANFLTNSWDTSIEYFKKLVDLDPNNAEKYHFLMWVASYWNEKYEQSVVMLSVIKDENLRLDAQRYLINNYLKLNQRNKMISSWNKLLWYEDLVASDFYTYFYETFYRPYSEWESFQIYAFDTELANKMLRVCAMKLPDDEKVVCTYGTIGKNIAVWQFDWLENLLLNLVSQYPQWYLYQALGEYYVQQWDVEKAKAYLLKAISLTQNKSEKGQIRKLLKDVL